MDWQQKLDEAARRAAQADDPVVRDGLALLVEVVEELARGTLPRKAVIE
jgi:hypothetical protein